MSVAIVFGASGSIGSAIGEHLQAQGFAVIGVGRNKNSASPPSFLHGLFGMRTQENFRAL